MKVVISLILILVGIIHLLPISGAVGANQLASLYGLDFNEPNLQILMRHRAILFGLLGLFLIVAAFRPPLQPLGIVAGLVSTGSFVALALLVGDYNRQIQTVFIVDIVAIFLLLLSGLFYFFVAQTTS